MGADQNGAAPAQQQRKFFDLPRVEGGADQKAGGNIVTGFRTLISRVPLDGGLAGVNQHIREICPWCAWRFHEGNLPLQKFSSRVALRAARLFSVFHLF
jgi:hypothetical protein